MFTLPSMIPHPMRKDVAKMGPRTPLNSWKWYMGEPRSLPALPNRGWKFSWTRSPTTASMLMRPCLSSLSLQTLRVSSSTPLLMPKGSK